MLDDFKKWLETGRNSEVSVIAITLITYFSELSNRTFFSDYYYEARGALVPISSHSYDSRLLAEFLRLKVFGGYVEEFLPMLLGLLLLCAAAFVITTTLKIKSKVDATLASLILTINPIFSETFSYTNTVFIVPLGIFCGALAAYLCIRRHRFDLIYSAILLVCSLELYQSAFFSFFLVVICSCICEAVRGEGVLSLLKKLSLFLSVGIVALVVNVLILKLAVNFWFPFTGQRVGNLLQKISGFDGVLSNLIYQVGAVFKFYTSGSFCYQFTSKFGFFLIYLFVLAELLVKSISLPSNKTRIPLVLALILVFPFIPSVPFIPFLDQKYFCTYRMMFTQALVMVVVFVLATNLNKRFQFLVRIFVTIFLVTSVFDLNAWHQFMRLKGENDKFISQNIADRALRLPEFTPGMPMVLVGVSQFPVHLKGWYPPSYFADPEQCGIQNGSTRGVFEEAWSSWRVILAYLPVRDPMPEETAFAVSSASQVPAWPHPASTFIASGVLVQKMGPTGKP